MRGDSPQKKSDLWPKEVNFPSISTVYQTFRKSQEDRRSDKEGERRHLEAERVMKERETRYVHWLEVNDDCRNNLFNSYSKHFISKQNTPTTPHPDREITTARSFQKQALKSEKKPSFHYNKLSTIRIITKSSIFYRKQNGNLLLIICSVINYYYNFLIIMYTEII